MPNALLHSIAFLLCMLELVQALAINGPPLETRQFKCASGRQRQAISALEADIKRHGTRDSRARGLGVYDSR